MPQLAQPVLDTIGHTKPVQQYESDVTLSMTLAIELQAGTGCEKQESKHFSAAFKVILLRVPTDKINA